MNGFSRKEFAGIFPEETYAKTFQKAPMTIPSSTDRLFCAFRYGGREVLDLRNRSLKRIRVLE